MVKQSLWKDLMMVYSEPAYFKLQPNKGKWDPHSVSGGVKGTFQTEKSV